MASRLLTTTMLLMWMAIASSEANNKTQHFEQETHSSVFEWGNFTTVTVNKATIKLFKPPKELMIISPKQSGIYPILYFVHGTGIPNHEYSQLFNFIASHGIIVVAPMLYRLPLMPSHQNEIDDAARVLNWLSANINAIKPGEPSVHILPDNVTANLTSLAVSGHSRGGKTAFALVLGKTKQIKLDPTIISAAIALDPVAGFKSGPIKFETNPHILTNVANSINLSVPTMIIGTGLGNQSFKSCAPNGLNHDQIYKECRETSHFVTTDYGHCDMLNDRSSSTCVRAVCGSGKRGTYDLMRRTVGGLIVAFLDAFFRGNSEQYLEILSHPSVAPAKLYPVGNKADQPLLYSAA